MAVSERAREVFRRIGEVESEVRPAPATFDDALATLSRLLERDRAMFPDREVAPRRRRAARARGTVRAGAGTRNVP